MDQQVVKLLTYTGKAQDFPIWSTRFVAMMQTKGLYKSLLGREEQPNEPAPLANGSTNNEKNHKVLKDAYEKEVADIKEKRNNVWCHLALTLDAITLMLMRHDCVGDDGIGDGAKAWMLLPERFQSVETPTVVTFVAQLARLQLEDSEDLDSFFIRGQELLTRLQEAGEAVSETLFNALVLSGLPMRYESFVIQESFNPATNFTELRKRLQNYLVYIPNKRKVGSIPDNKETADLLDDGSELGIWHPDDDHQDDDNRERQDTSIAIKEEWHDAGSVNTQETTLRQKASDVGETALDEGSTATRGSHKDSESLEDSETEDFLQLETVGFNEDALQHADRAEPRRGTRARNVPQFFGEVRTHLAVTEGDYVEPKAVYEAKQRDVWDQWHRAMKDEVKALQDNETWNLVRPPTDRDVIPGKRVYKVKLGPSGQVDKYKARYVAKGLKQVEGLDYFETFAPNCKPETFRILLQLSAKQGHVMHQFDVKTAFLHSTIEEEVYLEQTQEFVKRGSDGEKYVD